MKKLIIVASVVAVASVGAGAFALSSNNVQHKSKNEVTRRVTAEKKVTTPDDTTPDDTTKAPVAPAEEVAQPTQPVVEQPKATETAPEPAPEPVAPEMSRVEKIVRAMAEKQGVNADTLVSYATCVSGLNESFNYTNSRGQKGMGIFGFSYEDFYYIEKRYGVKSSNPYDPEFQSYAASKLLADGVTYAFCK